MNVVVVKIEISKDGADIARYEVVQAFGGYRVLVYLFGSDSQRTVFSGTQDECNTYADAHIKACYSEGYYKVEADPI